MHGYFNEKHLRLQKFMNSFGVIDLGGKGQLLFLWNVLTWFSKNNGQHYPNNFFRQLVLQKQPPEVFYKKDVLTNFTKFTEKHLCQGLFFNKVAGTGVFLWILWNYWEHLFLQSTSGRLLQVLQLFIANTIFITEAAIGGAL